MSITIASFDGADHASVDEAYRIGSAVNDVDLPDFPPFCRRRFDALFHTPMPGTRSLWALARLDGVPAGYLQLDLPQLDNPDNATAELLVHPDLRRRGVGRALHEYGVRLLREHGRKRVVAMAVSALPGGPARSVAGDAFAAATGAQPALAEVRRRLDVDKIDRVALRAALAEAGPRAEGYQSVCWQGTTPPEYVTDIAYLDGRLLMDAPMGDVQWEPSRSTPSASGATNGRWTPEVGGATTSGCGTRRPAGWSPGRCWTWAPPPTGTRTSRSPSSTRPTVATGSASSPRPRTCTTCSPTSRRYR